MGNPFKLNHFCVVHTIIPYNIEGIHNKKTEELKILRLFVVRVEGSPI